MEGFNLSKISLKINKNKFYSNCVTTIFSYFLAFFLISDKIVIICFKNLFKK